MAVFKLLTTTPDQAETNRDEFLDKAENTIQELEGKEGHTTKSCIRAPVWA